MSKRAFPGLSESLEEHYRLFARLKREANLVVLLTIRPWPSDTYPFDHMTMQKFTGKTAVVNGAASGFGLGDGATARRGGRGGHWRRSQMRAGSPAKSPRSRRREERATPRFVCDLADSGAPLRLAETAFSNGRPVDPPLNSAGISPFSPGVGNHGTGMGRSAGDRHLRSLYFVRCGRGRAGGGRNGLPDRQPGLQCRTKRPRPLRSLRRGQGIAVANVTESLAIAYGPKGYHR